MESGKNCLEELLVACPKMPWLKLELSPAFPENNSEGLKYQRTELMKYQPRVQSRTGGSTQPLQALLDIRHRTQWLKSAAIDGMTHTLGIKIWTIYRHSTSSQESRSTVADRVVSAQSQACVQIDGFDYDALIKLHTGMIQSVFSGKYADVDDIAHRLAFTAFLLHDSEPQNPPLDFVAVTLETHRKYKSLEDRESIDTAPTNLQQINASLQMLRTSYEQVKGFAFNEAPLPNNHVVHVALGSNVGDRMEMIERACKSMETQNLKVVRTSSLYETAPMYMEDQAPFINGVCQVSAEAVTQV